MLGTSLVATSSKVQMVAMVRLISSGALATDKPGTEQLLSICSEPVKLLHYKLSFVVMCITFDIFKYLYSTMLSLVCGTSVYIYLLLNALK